MILQGYQLLLVLYKCAHSMSSQIWRIFINLNVLLHWIYCALRRIWRGICDESWGKMYASGANQQEAIDESLTVFLSFGPGTHSSPSGVTMQRAFPCIFPGIFGKTNAQIPRRQERSLCSVGTRSVHFQRFIDKMSDLILSLLCTPSIANYKTFCLF
jgi:hypothetical protein